jgi:glycosyltransferase involved in cell wall biosynthesis
MRILLWHVHGSWTTAFVQGGHRYLIPVTPDRGPDGRGRADTWEWPSSAVEVTPAQLRAEPVDAVLLQRPHELALATEWLGRVPGKDLPSWYVEHNTPGGDVPFTRHPMADQTAIPIVHVTYFNQLFWDCGRARTTVVGHGIPDPGYRYTGDLDRAAVAMNDPVRRGRAVGTDLLPELTQTVPLDVFGMNVAPLADARIRAYENPPQETLHTELPRRRVYVHTARWTSLGLSMLEAMHLGMPVVALASTETPRAVPPDAGVVTADVNRLAEAVQEFVADPDRARATGRNAREAALARYGLDRFLKDWDALLGG